MQRLRLQTIDFFTPFLTEINFRSNKYRREPVYVRQLYIQFGTITKHRTKKLKFWGGTTFCPHFIVGIFCIMKMGIDVIKKKDQIILNKGIEFKKEKYNSKITLDTHTQIFCSTQIHLFSYTQTLIFSNT